MARLVSLSDVEFGFVLGLIEEGRRSALKTFQEAKDPEQSPQRLGELEAIDVLVEKMKRAPVFAEDANGKIKRGRG